MSDNLLSIFLTADEVEARLGIKTGTLRQWAQRRHIPRPIVWYGIGFYSPWPILGHILKKAKAKP